MIEGDRAQPGLIGTRHLLPARRRSLAHVLSDVLLAESPFQFLVLMLKTSQ